MTLFKNYKNNYFLFLYEIKKVCNFFFIQKSIDIKSKSLDICFLFYLIEVKKKY